MFRVVFRGRLGKGSFIGLTLLLVALAGTVSAARPINVFAASTPSVDTCGYNPNAAPAPTGGTVAFNENTITRAIQFYGIGLGGHVGVFTNDESGLFIGSGGTPSSAVPGQVYGEAMPPTFGVGSDVAGRPFAPTIYLTDITSNASATGGDWEKGGQPATTGASGLFGSWSATLGKKPVNKNNWILGPHADPIPPTDAFGGVTVAYNEGYGSEVTWNVGGLKAYDPTTGTFVALQPGHTYRVQSLTHDTDENKGQGDVGEVCTTFSIPSTPAAIQIVKTADAAQVNAGDQIGFTLTVSNTGTGAATGVIVNDLLPTNAGLSWTIAGQGAGFSGSAHPCAINAGTLICGPVTVPAGTTQGASTYTVHITSPTTAATGGSCPSTGVVNNTGSVTSTDGGSGQSNASTCVSAPGIQIVKTPDAAVVNAGDPIGFTLTVYNNGPGDAKDVMLSDPLPAKAGLSWQIASQGGGWAGTCSIKTGTLSCGKVTVPHGTTQAGSTFTVHITSPTTAATGGSCPGGTGVVDNTGTVTSQTDSRQSSASTCVQGSTDIQITKTGSPAVDGPPIGNITWTMVVTNNGPLVDTNVTVADPMPAGNTYVSSTATKGSCTGGAMLSCSLGTLQVGESVTIVLVTTPTTTGTQTNTATVVGDLPETTLTNNTASAHVLVVGPHRPLPRSCTAVLVRPKQLFVGRSTKMHLKVTSRGRAVAGVRVRIKGPGLAVITRASNSKGQITRMIKPKKAGIVVFRPIANKSCATPRVGVTGVSVPPVTG